MPSRGKRKQIIVKLTPEMYERVQEIAKKFDVPVSVLVRIVLSQWIEKQGVFVSLGMEGIIEEHEGGKKKARKKNV